MWHSHLNDMEIPETKRFIPKGFELCTTLSQPIGSIIDMLLLIVTRFPLGYPSSELHL